ncbi:autotransporter outer membrane beta-barrel domain-containing protein [Enterobacter cancerogenus]|uniref:autotransporter outer membrane beta-barrel domain-containing protein n=1 Tax=Enterobacter cancerogenus TaxID=69218 RepID=UPI0005390543|nr:autotransporter outer membrane beta-barrel domain-containing protein [Enterobacter cancerogenus]KGT92662.1 hypothetical protein NH00_04705 [Enterobacter cancerogenus]
MGTVISDSGAGKQQSQTLNDQRFSNDLAGTRAEMTWRMPAQLQPDLQLYTAAATSKGRHMNSPLNAAFGVRWSW